MMRKLVEKRFVNFHSKKKLQIQFNDSQFLIIWQHRNYYLTSYSLQLCYSKTVLKESLTRFELKIFKCRK